MRVLNFTPFLLLALAGCEKPIGTYRIDRVALVAGSEAAAIDNFLEKEEKMVRIDFSSETDAVAAADADLSVSADYCPLRRRQGFRMLGPYPDGAGQFLETGRRHPKRDSTGRYHYVAYLDLASVSDTPKGYDLRSDPRDICLRVIGSYMFSRPPRSEVFVLPKAALAKVLQGS